MKTIRAASRFTAFLLFTILILLFIAISLPLDLIQKKWRLQCKNWLISRWASGIAVLLGITIEIKGTPPEPPFFLVSNHLSYMDILPYWKHLKSTFIAKSEIQKWPFFGQAAWLLDIIFIERKNRKDINRVNTLIEHSITPNQGVILFPEGTSSKGRHVLPYKSSLLYYPASQGIPVYYASISYEITGASGEEAWKRICWWGDMDFFSHFWELLKIKSWKVTVQFAETPILNKNRKKLAGLLHQHTVDIFEPTFRDPTKPMKI